MAHSEISLQPFPFVESMSNVPFIVGRAAPKYGGDTIKDLINHDGLTDAYTNMHMGTCAEAIIKSGVVWQRR